MKKYNKTIALIALIVAGGLLASCVPGDGSNNPWDLAGFFSGVWHGWIAPVTLVLSLFFRDWNIYEVYNNGFFYNLGFYAAIVGGFGGLSLARRRFRKDRD
ncbi:MAG: hypothetical protein LBS19_12265 [Clostridiales bacterium]|jgi:hypothetical protein|nr:hypothetical protein [Clostridiales bacterium]